ncbi:DJ-1/PfpI family protein [Pseudarthrobacter sp. N5]|uniref:DJ-1/PfpI family protein n=1 Tax=Pseudarthrobacter sp. N5 TaxID=3418416 RepID=UPI003CF0F672
MDLRHAAMPRRAWYYISSNKSIVAIDSDDYDLLVIPGGKPDGAPTTVRNNTKAVEIARSFFAKNKPVAARWCAGINNQGRRKVGGQRCGGRWKSRHVAVADEHSRIFERNDENGWSLTTTTARLLPAT